MKRIVHWNYCVFYIYHAFVMHMLESCTGIQKTGSKIQAPGRVCNIVTRIKVYRLKLRVAIYNKQPVFLNVYGAPESIPRNEFRQLM